MTRPHCSLATGLLLLATWCLTACGGPQGERAPNVILISVDSLRADHTSLIGYERRTTPELERFAEDAVVYTKAQAQASWTRPSYRSMLTGRWNSDLSSLHREDGKSNTGSLTEVYDNPFGIPSDAPTLAGLLQDSGFGFITVGRAQNHNLSRDFNFGSGFHSYDAGAGLMASAVLEQALEALDELADDDDPFFLFVHFEQAHYPFPSEAPYSTMWSKGEEEAIPLAKINQLMSRKRIVLERKGSPLAQFSEEELRFHAEQLPLLYDRSIAEVDANIGLLLQALRDRELYAESLILFNSDHGEEFGEHGRWGHGHSLKQELLHIPLAIKYPASMQIPAARIEQPVSNLDLLPTILAAVGLGTEHDWVHGRDLNPKLLSPSHPFPISEAGPDHGIGRGGSLSIRGPRYKLTYHFDDPIPGERREEAYDLQEDPGEQSPLLTDNGDLQALRKRLDAWLLQHRPTPDWDHIEGMDSSLGTSEETLQGLQELGYVGGE